MIYATKSQKSVAFLASKIESEKLWRVHCGEGYAFMVTDVTTPNVPPPPPRSAQKRSGLRQGFAVRYFPSGVTILTSRTLSTLRPCVLEDGPWPVCFSAHIVLYGEGQDV